MSTTRQPDQRTTHDGRPLPDQVTMGLLAYLNTHTLDEDYELAAQRRAAAAARAGTDGSGSGGAAATREDGGRPSFSGWYVALVLGVFALLAVTAGAQSSRNDVPDEGERRQLIEQISARQERVAADRERIEQLREENERLENEVLPGDPGSGIQGRRTLLRLRAGTSPVRGSGIRVVVNDAPDAGADERRKVLDTDLQHLVNGLWQAGAEAIAVNNQRLSNLSAIRYAGSAITVNFRSLSPPYTVSAIGDADTMPARFAESTSGQTWLDLQREVGLRFEMRSVGEMTLPAYELRDLRFARPLGERDREERLP